MNATAHPIEPSPCAHWLQSLGLTRIFRSFAVATHPPKLLLALLLVLSLYLLGRLMDLGGGRYYSGEFAQYVMRDRASFAAWRANQLNPSSGLFAAALELELAAFQRLVAGAAALNFGIAEGLDPSRHDPNSVVGALREMFLTIPAWLLDIHPVFAFFYGLAGLGIWALLGGAICRLAAVHLARGTTIPAAEAVQYAAARWHWFFLAPLLPILAMLAVGILLAIAGFLLLNWPVLNMIGGLGFGLALAAGAIIALLLIAWVTGVHMVAPAIAAENTDAFDAVSRAFSYVLSRPWRWLWYTVLCLVYGALTYLFVGLVVFLTLGVTRFFVGWWMSRTAGRYNAPWLDAALPAPLIGKFHYSIDWSALDATGKVSAGLMAVWVYILMGVLVAYAISFYIAAQTNIYLLLRQSADGTPAEEVFQSPQEPAPAAAAGLAAAQPGSSETERSGVT